MADDASKLDSLPYRVDIGGIVYNLRSDTRVFAGDYSEIDFKNTFKTYPKNTEYLLRKYMFQDVTPKENIVFDKDQDKTELIAILERRIKQIEESIDSTNTNYNQSILINRKMGRSAQNILEIINKLKNTKIAKKSIDNGYITKTIEKLSPECIYELILEISWMLLNFDTVSIDNKDVIESWMELVKSLPHLKLEHMVKMLGQETETETPTNFFKNSAVVDSKSGMEKLIKTLLNILEIKRYLTTPNKSTKKSGGSKSKSKEQTETIIKKIKFDKKMSNAMIPLFDYFKELYDPVYSFIDECALSYKINSRLVSELLDILHICNNIHNPGVYRIKNVSNILPFIKHIINNTKSHMISDKHFIDKISQLPKVRLTTFLKESTLNINRHIQLFSVDDNLTIHPESRLNNRIKTFFNKKDLYITCTESSSIPMKLHEIDFNTIDVTSNDIETYTLKPFHSSDLDEFVSLNKNLNDSEIALSIFILFKELIYK